jgi:hypothetical protein
MVFLEITSDVFNLVTQIIGALFGTVAGGLLVIWYQEKREKTGDIKVWVKGPIVVDGVSNEVRMYLEFYSSFAKPRIMRDLKIRFTRGEYEKYIIYRLYGPDGNVSLTLSPYQMQTIPCYVEVVIPELENYSFYLVYKDENDQLQLEWLKSPVEKKE